MNECSLSLSWFYDRISANHMVTPWKRKASKQASKQLKANERKKCMHALFSFVLRFSLCDGLELGSLSSTHHCSFSFLTIGNFVKHCNVSEAPMSVSPPPVAGR